MKAAKELAFLRFYFRKYRNLRRRAKLIEKCLSDKFENILSKNKVRGGTFLKVDIFNTLTPEGSFAADI